VLPSRAIPTSTGPQLTSSLAFALALCPLGQRLVLFIAAAAATSAIAATVAINIFRGKGIRRGTEHER